MPLYDRRVEDNRLTWLRVPDPAELPADVHALWEPSLDKLGFVPNVLRLYALRPTHLVAWTAVKLTRDPTRMVEADVETLRDAGWTDEDVMDIAEVTGMFNMSNRMASGLGWAPNPQYESLGR